MIDSLSDSFLNMLLSFALLGALYIPLEWSFRARKQPYNRPGIGLDLCYFFLQFMFALGLSLAFVEWLGDNIRGPAFVTVTVNSWPLAAQIIAVIICADLAQYWGHRLSHSVPLLWRFHGVHHTATRLDWLAAYREHPIDGLYSQLLLMGPAAFMGVHPLKIMPVLVFRGLWAVLVHTNTRLPLGPLGILLGDPVLHRWHHAKRITEHNYANLAPYLDLIFGTHHRPENEDYSLGVEGDFSRTFVDQLIPGWERLKRFISFFRRREEKSPSP